MILYKLCDIIRSDITRRLQHFTICHIAADMLHIVAICHIAVDMLHSLTIRHIAVDMLHIVAICRLAVDMLHSVAKCHIAVNMSNRSKICPYKMKKYLRQTAPHTQTVKLSKFVKTLKNSALPYPKQAIYGCVLRPWPRNFFVSLALASSLVSSTPPVLNTGSISAFFVLMTSKFGEKKLT